VGSSGSTWREMPNCFPTQKGGALPKKKSKIGAHVDLGEKMIFHLYTLGVLQTTDLLWTF
jgi:hypothetical protein